MHELAAKVDEYARGMISGSGSTLFEELGLYYIGPVDGHNIDDLVAILKEVKSTKTTGPVLIHVVTEKGRGYPYAEKAADKYHGNMQMHFSLYYIVLEFLFQTRGTRYEAAVVRTNIDKLMDPMKMVLKQSA